MRYFVSISYSGKNYSGWQIQNNALSIEEILEKAFSIQLAEPIDLVGAGRTDTSVNAIGYIAHFDSENENICKELDKTLYKINAILPHEINVFNIFAIHPEAHARYDATSRTYKYFVHTVNDPFSTEYSTFYKFPLDIEAMNQAADYLLGEKDFSCFEKLRGGNNTSICTVIKASWESYTPNITNSSEGHYVFTITANRFLRNMVRAIVGSLLEIGRGKQKAEWILELLEIKNRTAAGSSVPGNALFLCDITYPYETNKNNK